MKIGVDASFLRKPGTGIGVVTEQTLREFSRLPEALRHRFVLYSDGDVDIPYLPSERFETRVFLPWWRRDDVPRRILWERRLPKEAARDGCDAFLSLSQSATVFPKRLGIRHTMVVHDVVPLLFPEYRGRVTNRLHTGLIGRAVPRADRIVAVSETTKRELASVLDIPEGRILVASPDCLSIFRDPVSDGDLHRVMQAYNLESGYYIYHGGGLEIRKNTEGLLRAYAELLGKREDVPPLIISGKVHPKDNRLATDVSGLIRSLGLGDRVKLLGFVPEGDLPALYRGAVCFAYPSRYEGFGLPVVEAMAVGTPVLAGRDSGAIPEIVGDAALLVDIDRPEDIAAGLSRLLDSATFRADLVGRGKERVRDFSWRRFAETILNTLIPDREAKDTSDSKRI